jgi:hypothetical protein
LFQKPTFLSFEVYPRIYSRLTKPECSEIEDIKDALAECNISFDKLEEVDQENCHEIC